MGSCWNVHPRYTCRALQCRHEALLTLNYNNNNNNNKKTQSAGVTQRVRQHPRSARTGDLWGRVWRPKTLQNLWKTWIAAEESRHQNVACPCSPQVLPEPRSYSSILLFFLNSASTVPCYYIELNSLAWNFPTSQNCCLKNDWLAHYATSLR